MPVLSEELRQQILAYIPRYPSKQAVTLPALHIVHDALRCVPFEAIREIAAMLELSPAEVYDTMTFYQFFREEKAPMGRTRLWVCRSLACALRGGDALLTDLCQRLQVQPGDTTADGQLTLEFAECLGACEGAPAVMVNDEHEHCMTPDLVESVVAWSRQARGAEVTSSQLLQAITRKGRTLQIARAGSSERRLLRELKANGAVQGTGFNNIVLREEPRKVEVLEMFLRGTLARIQQRKNGVAGADEVKVRRFMRRHRRLLGITEQDTGLLGDN